MKLPVKKVQKIINTFFQKLPSENRLPIITLSFTLAALIVTIIAVQQQQNLVQNAAEKEECPLEEITSVDENDDGLSKEDRQATRTVRKGEDGNSVTAVATGQTGVTSITTRTTEAPTIVVGGNGQLVGESKVKPPRRKGQIIVKYKQNKSKQATDDKIKKRNGRLKKRNEKLRLDVIQVSEADEAAMLKELAQDPNVQYAEKDLPSYGFYVPNDPKFTEQYYLNNTGQAIGGTKGKNDADIDAVEAWDITKGDKGVKIAILDTGIDKNHPELKSKIAASKDFTGKGNTDDGAGHGTFIAGIIAGETNNGEGVAGVCPNCTLLIGKVLDDNAHVDSIEPIAEGIDWAIENGAKVINVSFGQDQPSQSYEQIFKEANDKGVLIIASAGNCGGSDWAKHDCATQNPKTFPASYDYVLSVASTDNKDNKAQTSEFGSWVNVAAPGYYIYTTAPLQSYTIGGATSYTYLEGTSFAAPMVSGIAGLLLSKNPGMSKDAIRNQIEKTADKINGTGSLWQFGRVNAAKALGASTTNPDPTTSNSSDSGKPNRTKTPKPSCKPKKNSKDSTPKPTKAKAEDSNPDRTPNDPKKALCSMLPDISMCKGETKAPEKNCDTSNNNSNGSGREGTQTNTSSPGKVTTGNINTDETSNTTIKTSTNGETVQDINTGGKTGGSNTTNITISKDGENETVNNSGGSNNQPGNNSDSGDCGGASTDTSDGKGNTTSPDSSLLCRLVPSLSRCTRDDSKSTDKKDARAEKKDERAASRAEDGDEESTGDDKENTDTSDDKEAKSNDKKDEKDNREEKEKQPSLLCRLAPFLGMCKTTSSSSVRGAHTELPVTPATYSPEYILDTIAVCIDETNPTVCTTDMKAVADSNGDGKVTQADKTLYEQKSR